MGHTPNLTEEVSKMAHSESVEELSDTPDQPLSTSDLNLRQITRQVELPIYRDNSNDMHLIANYYFQIISFWD